MRHSPKKVLESVNAVDPFTTLSCSGETLVRKVTILHISDTHNLHRAMSQELCWHFGCRGLFPWAASRAAQSNVSFRLNM